MNVGMIIDQIECVDMSTDGQGICYEAGAKIFVDELLPGEKAQIKITKITRKYSQGVMLKLYQGSDDRIGALVEQMPEVQLFGGCDLAWINYPAQLKLKQQLTQKAMRLASKKASFSYETIVPSNPVIHYRNKMYFALTKAPNGQVYPCFYLKGSKQKELATDDVLAVPQITQLLQAVTRQLTAQHVPIFDHEQEEEGLKTLMFRYAETTDEMMITFVSTVAEVPGLDHAVQALCQAYSQIKSVILNINERKHPILSEKELILYGKEVIYDQLLDCVFEIPSQAFYQVNRMQAVQIYQAILDQIQRQPATTLLDLYCGIGTIGLLAAAKVEEVIGIDIVPAAIEAAENNAQRNQCSNIRFIAGDVETELAELELDPKRELIVVIDPPRKGCTTAFLDAIIELKPQTIFYVSCNPSTLARDIVYLAQEGYTYGTVSQYDMFPQTLHVESLVVLRRG